MQTLVRSSLIALAFLVSLSACKTNEYPKTTPHVIDTDLSEVREYEIIDPKNMIVKYKQSHPMTVANGMWCIPKEQVGEWKTT